MSASLKLVNGLQIILPENEPGLMAIKANGIAMISRLYKPVLVPRKHDEAPEDGILEFDIHFVPAENTFTDVEMEVDLVLNKDELPSWVKGLRINAAENSEIELI
jgi:hypothetical protein